MRGGGTETFERFTERARQVVVLAQDEARALGHGYIGTEHLLLGLLREEEGLGAGVLDALGIPIDEVRSMVSRIVGREDEIATGQIPFTPRAKKVLELSLREALSLGHNYVGTEHLLLGLARENGGLAARILLDFGVDPELIRSATIDFLSGSTKAISEWQQRKEREEAKAAAANPGLAERLALAREEKARALGGAISVMSRRGPAVHERPAVGLLVAGAAIFAIALAIGLLLGYLIWH